MFRQWLKSLAFGAGTVIPLLFLIVILYLVFRKRQAAGLLAFAGLLAICLITFPGTADLLSRGLLQWSEKWDRPSCLLEPQCQAEAIVVVAGGITNEASLSDWSLVRLQKGMELWHAKKAPLLVLSGGKQNPDFFISEAEALAKEAMRFGIPQKAMLLEQTSRNTYEQAQRTSEILKQHQIKKIVLVTSRFHLPRAAAAFRKAGLETIPVAAIAKGEERMTHPFPSWGNALSVQLILNEYVGFVVYKFLGWL